MLKKITLLLVAFLFLAAGMYAANQRFTLVIDAGHGGHDAGALGAKSKEKNINLNVALAFGNYVERNCPDVKVVYTRKTDVFVTLHERANIANRHKADLFVSIHTNALPAGKQARGLETYTLGMNRANENFDVAKRENAVILYEKDYEQHYEGFDPNSSESYIMFEFMQDKNMAQSVDLAKMVQKRACSSANRQNKGVKQAGFLVLRETSMPSCLIELGFITTPQEEQQLNTRECIDALGYGIFQAFVDYRNKYDKTIIVPFEAPERQVMENQAQERVQKESEGGKTQTAEQEKDNVPRSESKMVNEVPEQKPATDSEAPIFKIQVLTSTTLIRQGDKRLKGLDGVDYYKDGGIYKYTIGASANYNEIYRLRKTMVGKFPQAFIIAFKNGQRTDVVAAIREFKQNRK